VTDSDQRPSGGRDWTDGHSYTDLRSRTLIVDGVTYSAAEVRRIVHERHQQALEIARLRATLKRADRHLKLRTAALIRLIAAEKPAALPSEACGERTCCSSRASGCSRGRSKGPAGSG
jgi:hypothetical protein